MERKVPFRAASGVSLVERKISPILRALSGSDLTEGQKRDARKRRGDTIVLLIVVAFVLAIMEIASWFVPSYIMPSPLVIWASLAELLKTHYSDVVITLARLAAAVAFSMVVGVIFGLIMGTFKKLGVYLRQLVILDTGIPALSWMLIAIFWFRNPEARIFFILTVILLPFYALNVYEGVRSIPKDWIDMIESFRPSRWQVMRYLVIPHIVPYVFMTTKSTIGYAIRMAIFAELVASAAGIGARMSFAQSTFRVDHVLAWTFLLVILNLVLQAVLAFSERKLLKWRAEGAVR
jgi:NitT/TauT family transport system permease protein